MTKYKLYYNKKIIEYYVKLKYIYIYEEKRGSLHESQSLVVVGKSQLLIPTDQGNPLNATTPTQGRIDLD